MNAAPIRIAIVDDQSLVRIGFRMLLDAVDDIDVIGEAHDGASAIALVQSTPVDVVLMDVRMPGVDGIAATAEITATPNGPRVIVLTTFDLDDYAFAALRAGASGFLVKDARPAELLSAIRTVHSGDAALAPHITRRLVELFAKSSAASAAPQTNDATHVLTPREREVLAAIALGRSNTEIASDLFLSESTVKTHVGRLLQKLSARDRVHLVILAYEAGIVSIGQAVRATQ